MVGTFGIKRLIGCIHVFLYFLVGILHTPPHLFNDASFKNGSNKYQSTPQQQKSKDEPSVSPDYWLKGRYSSPGNYSSTPQHHNSRRNQQRR